MLYAHPGLNGAKVSFKKRYGNYIGGEFVDPVEGRWFDNTTPVTGICAGHMPIRCQQMGIFTIRTGNFAANANAPSAER